MRTNISAVSGSSAPFLAECRASATSSRGERAEASSSVGSMPSSRRTRLAVSFRCRISGLKAAEKARWGVATRRAMASGRAMAQFFGTSSPITIITTVDSTVPITRAAVGAAAEEIPAERSGPDSSRATDGSESMPTTRLVTVMPSWAPES